MLRTREKAAQLIPRTSQRTDSDYVYMLKFNDEDKVESMHKTWNDSELLGEKRSSTCQHLLSIYVWPLQHLATFLVRRRRLVLPALAAAAVPVKLLAPVPFALSLAVITAPEGPTAGTADMAEGARSKFGCLLFFEE